MLVCLGLYQLESILQVIGFGCLYLRSWTASVEMVVTTAAILILCHDLFRQVNLHPHGLIRVLIIGIIFIKLIELHLRRSNRRELSRTSPKSQTNQAHNTPFESVVHTLNSLIERLPEGDQSVAQLNNALQIIAKGRLYESAIDVSIDDQSVTQND